MEGVVLPVSTEAYPIIATGHVLNSGSINSGHVALMISSLLIRTGPIDIAVLLPNNHIAFDVAYGIINGVALLSAEENRARIPNNATECLLRVDVNNGSHIRMYSPEDYDKYRLDPSTTVKYIVTISWRGCAGYEPFLDTFDNMMNSGQAESIIHMTTSRIIPSGKKKQEGNRWESKHE